MRRETWQWVAILVLALAVGANSLGLTGKASTGRVSAGLALGQRDQCIATNISRATDNRSHLADYRFITQQIHFTQSSLRSNYAALLKAGISKRVLDRALRQSEASLRSQRRDAATKTWTALSNCAAAPRPREALEVHSIAEAIPPKSALRIRNALRTDPVGSVG